jgi:ubiquinone/menaquinone biosynthesis C-methylase UbiE
MNDYKYIFDKRAFEYSYASEKYPEIRKHEFQCIINKAKVNKNQNVLDLACGNAVISNHLKDTIYYGIDPCCNFLKEIKQKKVVIGSLRRLPFKDDYFDHVICLTGLHHEISREEIYVECYRVLNDQGRFTIHDVKVNSDISVFLDNFVNLFNPSGHIGNYLGNDDVSKLQKIGFITQTTIVKYEWIAKDVKEMFDFMKNLFGLEELSVEKFATEIAKYLNISFDADSYRVHWNLLSIEAVKNDPH